MLIDNNLIEKTQTPKREETILGNEINGTSAATGLRATMESLHKCIYSSHNPFTRSNVGVV